MLNRLDRYLLREVTVTFVAVTGVLLIVLLSNQFARVLGQAAANAALAVRNIQVARIRVALLRDLPLGAGMITIPLNTGAPGSLIAPRQVAPLGPSVAPAGSTRAASASVIIP